jgi:hypothetical protein
MLAEAERLSEIAHETGRKEDHDAWRAMEDQIVKLDQQR